MKNQNDKFVVLGEKDGIGLTVGSYAIKPGSSFFRGDWQWGEEVLEAAIREKRCKLVESMDVKPVAEKVEEPKVQNESGNEKSDSQKKLEAMKANYANLDPESNKAIKLKEKINELETEIANGGNK